MLERWEGLLCTRLSHGFRELPGVTYKKRNVRTPARSFQEHQIRNYASFIANFQAFANSEHSDLRLFPHQFAFMDMVTITVDQKAEENAFAFTVNNEDISIVFQEKLSLSLNLMLLQFFDGTVAAPVFLLADKFIQSDEIVKVSIPDLSPYLNALGHVWVANPTGGGNKTFYKEYLKDIVLPAFRARAETKTKLQHLAQSSAAPQSSNTAGLDQTTLALLAFDCEVDQVGQAMDEELQPLLREVCLDLLKINAGLSFALSARDAGRTHTVLHKSARNLRSANKPSFLEPNTNLVKRMDRMIKAARNDIVQNKKYAPFFFDCQLLYLQHTETTSTFSQLHLCLSCDFVSSPHTQERDGRVSQGLTL